MGWIRFAALCALAALCARPVVAGVVWDVADAAALDRLRVAAAAGDELRLVPGPWGTLDLSGLAGTAEAPIRVRPAGDAEVAPTSLRLDGARHVVVEDLTLRPGGDGPAVSLRDAEAVTLDGLAVRGPGAGTGVAIRGGTGVTLRDLALADLDRGIVATHARHLRIEGVHGLRLGLRGIELRGGAWISVMGNRLEAFRDDGATSPGPMISAVAEDAAGPPSHVLVAENVLDGAGAAPRAGIELGDVHRDHPAHPPMRALAVRDNLVLTRGAHGLSVGPSEGAEVLRNAVLVARDAAAGAGRRSDGQPRLVVSELSRGAVVEGNWAHRIEADGPGSILRGNAAVQDFAPGQPDHYDAAFAAPRDRDPLTAFRPRPGGPLDASGGGPSLLRTEAAGAAAPVRPVGADGTGAARLRYDPATGDVTALDAAGRAAARAHAGFGSLPLGRDHPIVHVPAEMLGAYFDAPAFALRLRLRSHDRYAASGPILTIHPHLILRAGRGGSLRAEMQTAGAPRVATSVRMARLNDGAWHDVELTYDMAAQALVLRVDGAPPGVAHTSGRTVPMEHWGMTLGDTFGSGDVWEGEIGALELRSHGDGRAR